MCKTRFKPMSDENIIAHKMIFQLECCKLTPKFCLLLRLLERKCHSFLFMTNHRISNTTDATRGAGIFPRVWDYLYFPHLTNFTISFYVHRMSTIPILMLSSGPIWIKPIWNGHLVVPIQNVIGTVQYYWHY